MKPRYPVPKSAPFTAEPTMYHIDRHSKARLLEAINLLQHRNSKDQVQSTEQSGCVVC